MNKLILLSFMLVVGIDINAQKDVDQDSTHIISFVDKIILKANLGSESVSYIFNQNNETTYTFLTNNEYRLSLSVDYEFIGFSFGFAPDFFLIIMMMI